MALRECIIGLAAQDEEDGLHSEEAVSGGDIKIAQSSARIDLLVQATLCSCSEQWS